MTQAKSNKREFRNLNLFRDVTTYRLPPAGWASILHRASGAFIVLLLPFAIWMFDQSLGSAAAFEHFRAVLGHGLVRFIAWLLLAVYLLHLFGGVRHLVLDVTHRMTKAFGRQSAIAVFIASAIAALIAAILMI